MRTESPHPSEQQSTQSSREKAGVIAAGLTLILVTGGFGAAVKVITDGPIADVSKLSESITGNHINTQIDNK